MRSIDDGDLVLYADNVAVRVHASIVALRSQKLGEDLLRSSVDLGTGVRALEIRRGSDLSPLLNSIYLSNPLRCD